MEAGKNGSIDIGASTWANNKSKLYPKKCPRSVKPRSGTLWGPGELRISKSRAPIGGHLRRSRKSDIAAEATASADYATCRHAPRPKGEQRARGCVLCEPRSALTRSAPVAPPLRIGARRV